MRLSEKGMPENSSLSSSLSFFPAMLLRPSLLSLFSSFVFHGKDGWKTQRFGFKGENEEDFFFKHFPSPFYRQDILWGIRIKLMTYETSKLFHLQ